MPRYATGTMEAGLADLYDVADYADDAAAIAAFKASMRKDHPNSRLVQIGLDECDVVDFVARVADDFSLTESTLYVDEIVDWVAVYNVITDDEDDDDPVAA